jgi:hypothetical protein
LLGENNEEGEVISGLFANWTTLDVGVNFFMRKNFLL